MALAKTLWTSIVDLVSTGQNVSDNLDVAFSNLDDAIDQVDLNTADIVVLKTPPAYADLAPQVDPVTYSEGRFYYNANTGTFDIMGQYEGIIVSPGHGEHLHVVNNSGALIEAGMAVRIAGVAGGIPQIVKAQADTFANANVVGITVIDIPDTVESAVAITGVVRDLDTSLLPSGVPLYLSATVPGTYTSTAPAIRTEVGGVLVADAVDGQFRLDVKVNQDTPTVLGGLKGQNSPIYAVTTIVQDIVDYTLTREVVTTVDELLGIITLPNDGDYRVHFTADISFPSATSTRTLYLELYDATGALIHYTYNKNIPRDATEDSMSFTWTLEESAANVHKMRIRSNVPIAITFTEISFDIESISITA